MVSILIYIIRRELLKLALILYIYTGTYTKFKFTKKVKRIYCAQQMHSLLMDRIIIHYLLFNDLNVNYSFICRYAEIQLETIVQVIFILAKVSIGVYQ